MAKGNDDPMGFKKSIEDLNKKKLLTGISTDEILKELIRRHDRIRLSMVAKKLERVARYKEDPLEEWDGTIEDWENKHGNIHQ